MYLLFLDESGRIDQGGLFALGGIAVSDGDWPQLRTRWQERLSEADWPLDREIKWHGIRTGEVPPALADAVFDTLAAAPLTAHMTLLDRELGAELEPGFFRSPRGRLRDRPDVPGRALPASTRGGGRARPDRRRQPLPRGRPAPAPLLRRPDQGRDALQQLPRIIEGLFLGPSQHSIGLQCADLVVAMNANAERGPGQGRGSLRTLLPRFALHPATGELTGVGLKRFPERVPREHGRHRLV